MMDKHAEAINISKRPTLAPEDVAMRAAQGHAYGVTGRREEALAILGELLERAGRVHLPGCSVAIVYMGLGDEDQALAWLEKAAAQRDDGLLLMKVHPIFDCLRPTARFQELLRQLHLTA